MLKTTPETRARIAEQFDYSPMVSDLLDDVETLLGELGVLREEYCDAKEQRDAAWVRASVLEDRMRLCGCHCDRCLMRWDQHRRQDDDKAICADGNAADCSTPLLILED